MLHNKNKKWSNRTITILTIVCVIAMYMFYCSYQHNKGFLYSFNNIKVKFPLTVGEAIKTYKVIPHQYNRTGIPYNSPCPPNVKVNGISEIFYVNRADDYIRTPTDSLSKSVYALKFCFTQQSKSSFQRMKDQLEKDFGKKFDLEYNDDTKEPYYQLNASYNVNVIIEFYPEFAYITEKNKVQDYKSWAVSFCYNLFGPSIHNYTKYERNYDAQ